MAVARVGRITNGRNGRNAGNLVIDTDHALTLIQIIGGGALGTKLLRVLINTRDAIRDLMHDVGTSGPPAGPSGLFLRVDELAKKSREHENWLIRAGFDRRNTDDEGRWGDNGSGKG